MLCNNRTLSELRYQSAAKRRGGGTGDVPITEPLLVHHFPVPFFHEPLLFGTEGMDSPSRWFRGSQKVLLTRFKVFWVHSVNQARDMLHHTPSEKHSSQARRVNDSKELDSRPFVLSVVYICRLTRFVSSSNSELLFAALAPSPFGSWFGVAKAVASGTLCLLQGGLAVFGVTFRFGVVNVVLEPVLTLLLLAVSFGVGGGAFALVRHDPARAARPGRILLPAPVANHDWPSSLLPHGFDSDISLSATFRWPENCV